MARTGRPATAITLTEAERGQLTRWARRRKSSQALAMRCRIVLACADGLSNQAIAEDLQVSTDMVTKWRTRFARDRRACR
jgi:FixJ family two-component response regulator